MKLQIYTKHYLIIIILLLSAFNLKSQDMKCYKVDSLELDSEGHNYYNFFAIKCADSENCFTWSRLQGLGGFLLKRTTDGGMSWKKVLIDSGYFNDFNDYYNGHYLWDISYPNKNLFIACGDSGLIVRSTDNGETWNKYFIDTSICIDKINMLDEFYGILSATRQDRSIKKKGGGYYETFDGGKTWTIVNYPPDTNLSGFLQYKIFDKNTFCALVVILGQVPKGFNRTKLLWMNNHWTKWDTLNVPNEGTELSFADENNGWLAGGRLYDTVSLGRWGEVIFHTKDGGKIWDIQWDTITTLLPIEDIKFFDKDYGIAGGGYGHVLITHDGGKYWESNLLFEGADITGGAGHVSSIEIPSKNAAYAMYDYSAIYKYIKDTTLAVLAKQVPKIFSIFPDPAESYIYINLPLEFLTEKIKIYSIEGILVYQTSDILKMSDVSAKIDVSRFAAGVYYVKVGDRVCRFIKI